MPHPTEFIGRKLTEEAKYWIKDETVLALDLSDISKEYSKKQEFLALVRDGSRKGKIRKGYWTLGILGADPRGDRDRKRQNKTAPISSLFTFPSTIP